jgi:nicotinamide phosphoribosyltransferase
MIGGSAHLTAFQGTDTIVSMPFASQWYGANPETVGFSVNATEHNVMTARGEEGEFQVFEEILDEFPTGILSVVIDSYNWKRFVNSYARQLREKILARDGVVVFRPDSGNPRVVMDEVLEMLYDIFPGSMHGKYRKLNEKVGLIWGDGITPKEVKELVSYFHLKNESISNFVFGMGGGRLQKVNRDTQRSAFKSSAQCRSGEWHNIFKNPIDQSKKSKKGMLSLHRYPNGVYYTKENAERDTPEDLLKTVFLNGKVVTDYNFDTDIRRRIDEQIQEQLG